MFSNFLRNNYVLIDLWLIEFFFYFVGYVQSLIRRVVNNVNIVINNFILKYVEDDIVFLVNIIFVECYIVGELWDRVFMDIFGE